MKYIVFLGDGMADYPIAELGGLTPLGKAVHPALDRMACCGEFGLAATIPKGMPKSSDVANLAVMGYNPAEYYSGRSPFEALSIGVSLSPADVTYRCNLVTLSGASSPKAAVMDDYSAGEISSDEAAELIAIMNERFASDSIRFYPGVSYRHCLVLKNADTGAQLTPPHDISHKPAAGFLPSGEHSALLNEMIAYSYSAFRDHPINRARVNEGKNPATSVWFWGEGRKPRLPSFMDKYGIGGGVISAVDLLQGIGIAAGLASIHVEGVTGNYHTDFAAKGRAAIAALQNGADFIYIHVEAPDECGHHGELKEKVWSIEQIDEKIISPVLEYLDQSSEDYAALAMPDHPTPISILTHADDPVPFALYRRGDANKRDVRFCEKDAAMGQEPVQGWTLMDSLIRG